MAPRNEGNNFHSTLYAMATKLLSDVIMFSTSGRFILIPDLDTLDARLMFNAHLPPSSPASNGPDSSPLGSPTATTATATGTGLFHPSPPLSDVSGGTQHTQHTRAYSRSSNGGGNANANGSGNGSGSSGSAGRQRPITMGSYNSLRRQLCAYNFVAVEPHTVPDSELPPGVAVGHNPKSRVWFHPWFYHGSTIYYKIPRMVWKQSRRGGRRTKASDVVGAAAEPASFASAVHSAGSYESQLSQPSQSSLTPLMGAVRLGSPATPELRYQPYSVPRSRTDSRLSAMSMASNGSEPALDDYDGSDHEHNDLHSDLHNDLHESELSARMPNRKTVLSFKEALARISAADATQARDLGKISEHQQRRMETVARHYQEQLGESILPLPLPPSDAAADSSPYAAPFTAVPTQTAGTHGRNSISGSNSISNSSNSGGSGMLSQTHGSGMLSHTHGSSHMPVHTHISSVPIHTQLSSVPVHTRSSNAPPSLMHRPVSSPQRHDSRPYLSNGHHSAHPPQSSQSPQLSHPSHSPHALHSPHSPQSPHAPHSPHSPHALHPPPPLPPPPTLPLLSIPAGSAPPRSAAVRSIPAGPVIRSLASRTIPAQPLQPLVNGYIHVGKPQYRPGEPRSRFPPIVAHTTMSSVLRDANSIAYQTRPMRCEPEPESESKPKLAVQLPPPKPTAASLFVTSAASAASVAPVASAAPPVSPTEPSSPAEPHRASTVTHRQQRMSLDFLLNRSNTK